MAKKFAEHKGLDLTAINQNVLSEWEKNDIFHKSIDEREGCPQFIFFEGPPSANGHPGIHHVLARAIKDTFNRYKTMKGFQVHRKAGWDTHGLPVELGVEKELGITKKDIDNKASEKYISTEQYNAKCRDVYAYTGARLASNTIDMEGVGPKLNVEDVVELELYGCKEIENGVKGQIDILDVRFGSLWTSIPYEEFKKCGFKFGDNVLVKIFNRDVCVYTNTINYGKSFADVPISTPIIYMNSSYHIAVAINQGSFAKAYNIGVGSDWKITMQKSI